MAGAARKFEPLDRRAALTTGLAIAAIHPGFATVVAVDALQVPKVAERGAPGPDTFLEDVHDVVVERLALAGGEVGGDRCWSNATQKERFVGVDIANACNQRLV